MKNPKPELLLASHPCAQCLTTRGRIVSGQRAAELVRDCKTSGHHFVCHKGSIAGLNVHCRGVHNRFPSRAYQLAVALGIPIVEVNTDDF